MNVCTKCITSHFLLSLMNKHVCGKLSTGSVSADPGWHWSWAFRHWAVCYTSGCLGSLGTLLPGAGSKFPGSDAAKKPRSQTGAPPCFTVGEDVHWPQSSASVVCFFPSHYPSDQPSISGFFVFTSMEVGYCPMNLRLFYDVGNSGFLKVVL